jgi:hypothetical protein
MTTGRINQITIVRRGWPTGALGAGEIVQVTGGARGHARAALQARPSAPSGHPLSPSKFPRAPSTAPRPSGPCSLGAPGGGPYGGLQPFGVRLPGLPPAAPWCAWPSASHPQSPSGGGAAVARRPPPGIPSTRYRRSGPLRGRRQPLRAPRERGRGSLVCTEGRTVEVFEIRYRLFEFFGFPWGPPSRLAPTQGPSGAFQRLSRLRNCFLWRPPLISPPTHF